MARSVQAVLLSKDLNRLQTFYTDLLGATEFQRVPESGDPFYLGLQLGDGRLGLASAREAVAADSPQRMLISIEVDDVDALLDRVAAAGGRLTGGPTDMPWGQRVAHLIDPDGNLVNLTQQL